MAGEGHRSADHFITCAKAGIGPWLERVKSDFWME